MFSVGGALRALQSQVGTGGKTYVHDFGTQVGRGPQRVGGQAPEGMQQKGAGGRYLGGGQWDYSIQQTQATGGPGLAQYRAQGPGPAAMPAPFQQPGSAPRPTSPAVNALSRVAARGRLGRRPEGQQ